MTTVKHDGVVKTGDRLVYKTYSGALYGMTVLKTVTAPSGSVAYIGESGKVVAGTGKWEANDTLTVLTADDLSAYPMTWTEDKYKKGDILFGETDEGHTIVLYFVSEETLQRLSPLMPGYSQQGHGSLSFYECELSNLRVAQATSRSNNKRFSEI